MLDNGINYSSRTLRAIASNGLPLKIRAEYTENDYWERQHPDTDDLTCVAVRGWLIRINGKKYPRQLGEEDIDWTYRYTAPNTEEGMQTSIKRALSEARLAVC
jgi:hypothetical protein